jgi:hypothetical protein
MYPHRIRLRGPWQCEPLARAGGPGEPLPAPRQMTMPCQWSEGGLPGFAGRVRFRRRFGYPGRIDAHERVWLTFTGVCGRADVTLNGTPLGRRDGAAGPFEFEVTALLRPRNELAVEVESPADRGGLWGEVALEVRCEAFLRGVRAEPEGGGLRVTGEVVGPGGRPLELYVVVGRRPAGYATAEPAPQGRPFEILAEIPAAEAAAGLAGVRVDLVNGASIWDTHLLQCPLPPASNREA